MVVAYEYVTHFAQMHPGYDCMVATVKHILEIAKHVGNVFVGFPPSGSILCEAVNLVSRSCRTYKFAAGTFHLGTRNSDWGDHQYGDIYHYNREQGQLARGGLIRRKKCPIIYVADLQGRVSMKCFP
jgi:hypothetical protein